MQGAADNPRRTIAIFLALTLALSAVSWVPQIRAGKIDPLWITATMWSPGIAAIVTKLVTQRSLRGMGWSPRPASYLGLAYVLPILYALPVYLIAWFGGLGTFDEGKWIVAPDVGPWTGLAIIATVGIGTSMMTAAGEEIGWRGLLVPELMKITGFRNTVLISGTIWAAWHMPLLIGADYHGQGTPIWFSMACFVAMVLAISIVMAWITLKSGSLWPAAMLHAAHNLFVQGVFDAATVGNDLTNYWTGEFGVGLVLTIGIGAALLLKMRPIMKGKTNDA